MKTRVLFIALFILNIFQVSAQTTDEVTLVVSADGATKEEATKVALRSAIEQAYGTFVSANTTILNDEMVKDEIVTISNGNIKEYTELASLTLPNGNQSVTLKATVCISKLVSYAKSKGASTEFAGATFGMNLKMYELNKQNEIVVWDNLLKQVKEMIPSCFSTFLKTDEPKVMGDKCELSFNVTYIPNRNYFTLYKSVLSTLEGISIKDKQTIPNGVEPTKLRVDLNIIGESWTNKVYYIKEPVYLIRNNYQMEKKWIEEFNKILSDYFYGFILVDNTGQESSIDINEMWLGFDNRHHKGTGLFTEHETEHGPHGSNRAFGVFCGLEDLNLRFAQYTQTKKMTDEEKADLILHSSFNIKCTIPLSDVSKYSSFTIKDR